MKLQRPAEFHMSSKLDFLKPALKRLFCSRVLAGPFKGMRYVPAAHTGGPLLPKIIGSYELELRQRIAEFSTPGRYDTLVDCGAAEGWYAVGLTWKNPAIRVVAYELETYARGLLERMTTLNSVQDRVLILGAAEPAELQARLQSLSGRTCLIVDVEGYEEALLDLRAVPALAKLDILAEMHEMYVPDIKKKVLERFSQTHTIEFIPARQRAAADVELGWLRLIFSLFPGLCARMLRERPPGMYWAWMQPIPKAELPVKSAGLPV